MSFVRSFFSGVLSFDMTTILIFLFVLIATYYTFKTLLGPKLPPGPARYPVVGSTFAVDHTKPFWIELQRLAAQYKSDILTLDSFGRTIIVMMSGEMAKEAYQKRDDMVDRAPTNFFKYMEPKYQGILSSSGHIWKEHRRFTLFMLRDSGMGKVGAEQSIQDEAIELCRRVELVSADGGFDPLPILEPAVSNVICAMAFGQRYDYDNKEFNNALNGLNVMVTSFASSFAQMCLSPTLRWMVPFVYPAKHKEVMEAYEYWSSFVKTIINKHKEKFDGSNCNDLIDAFLDEQQKRSEDPESTFTDDQLRYLIQDLFLAGSETTTTTLRWALLILLKYPEMQEKIYDELAEAIGERSPSMNDKKSTPYTEAFLLEVQRFNTIVPNAVAHSTPVDIEFRGYTIPAGCYIISNLAAFHRDERVFDEPNTFKVERFFQNGKVVNADKVTQFGIGRRVCAGEALARAEIYIFFAAIVLKFKLEPTTAEVDVDGGRSVIYAPKPFKARAIKRVQS